MKKAAILMAIIFLLLITGSATADLGEIPVLPPLEEIVTDLSLESELETAFGDVLFIPAPAIDSLPLGEMLDCSTKLYYFGVWISPECNSH